MKTQADFRAYVVATVIPALLKTVTYKGTQYTGEDRSTFLNFEEGSKLASTTKEHYLMVQATKQWFVIADWSKDGSLEQANAREVGQRIFDVLVYCLILLFMLAVKEEEHADISG